MPVTIERLSFLLVALAAVVLLVVGTRDVAAPVAVADTATAGTRLPIGGLVLASVAVDLPAETEDFPAIAGGPGADAVNANCISCHSASMATNQPRLTAAQWAETVTKMRTVFKAPIAPGDDAAIIAYLAAMSAALPVAGAVSAAAPAASG